MEVPTSSKKGSSKTSPPESPKAGTGSTAKRGSTVGVENPSTENTPSDINAKLLEIVQDDEWKPIQNGVEYCELFTLTPVDDMNDNVEPEADIVSPRYTSSYMVLLRGKKAVPVKAQLPSASNQLYLRLSKRGYKMATFRDDMNAGIRFILPNAYPDEYVSPVTTLIIASPKIWQGLSAIDAGKRLTEEGRNVSVFLTEEPTKNDVLSEFIKAKGKVYKTLEEMENVKFDVVIVAFEDQASGERTNLSRYGKWLKDTAILFVDPPVLKCSYKQAIGIAIGEDYSTLKNKVVVMVPFTPKPYIVDEDLIFVVGGSVTDDAQVRAGIPEPIFPRLSRNRYEQVKPFVPVNFEEAVAREGSSSEEDSDQEFVSYSKRICINN